MVHRTYSGHCCGTPAGPEVRASRSACGEPIFSGPVPAGILENYTRRVLLHDGHLRSYP